MCMNCGCGDAEARHKGSDITLDDLREAAAGSGISVDQTVQNLQTSLEELPVAAGKAE